MKLRVQLQGNEIYQLTHVSEKTLNPGACPLLLRLYDKGCVAVYKEKHLRRILFMGLLKEPCYALNTKVTSDCVVPRIKFSYEPHSRVPIAKLMSGVF